MITNTLWSPVPKFDGGSDLSGSTFSSGSPTNPVTPDLNAMATCLTPAPVSASATIGSCLDPEPALFVPVPSQMAALSSSSSNSDRRQIMFHHNFIWKMHRITTAPSPKNSLQVFFTKLSAQPVPTNTGILPAKPEKPLEVYNSEFEASANQVMHTKAVNNKNMVRWRCNPSLLLLPKYYCSLNFVMKNSTLVKKLRPTSNFSAPHPSGSFNLLAVNGPNIFNSAKRVLLKFFNFSHAITTDISIAYRALHITKLSQSLSRFF